MRRLLLVANTNAHTFTPYRHDVVVRALGGDFAVEVALTKRSGHAFELARGAVHEGFDLVVAWGGDGTVNEVANGLAGSRVPLGILPGGLANVFATSLGIPGDAVDATGFFLAKVGGQPRPVPLGRVDGRYFTTNCGVGLDAAIVREVERRQGVKRAAGTSFFVWTALRVFFFKSKRRRPRLTLSWGPGLGQERGSLFMVAVQNTDPYTFVAGRAMRLCPDARLDGGLDGFALATMRASTVLALALSALGRARRLRRSRHAVLLHDQPRLRIRCSEPMPVQVDGEYLGEREELLVESVREALWVVC